MYSSHELDQIPITRKIRVVRKEGKLENETVWLNRQQLAELFDRDVKTIGKHINNALKKEYYKIANQQVFLVVKESLTTADDGKVI